jgi:integral membrane protein (TIGR01906 family)
MYSKIGNVIASAIFILYLPFLLLSASIAGTANSPWLYEYGFQKFHVGATTGLDDAQLKKVANGLVKYFNSSDEYIDLRVEKYGVSFQLFNERETVHLKDVKGLIRLDYQVLLWTAIYALGCAAVSLLWRRRRYWRRLAWGMIGGSGLTLALVLALGLGTLFDFNQVFLQFHLLSFANDLWQLDPTRDFMIMLFPWGFFYSAFLIWSLLTLIGALILGGAAGGYLLSTRRRAQPSST